MSDDQHPAKMPSDPPKRLGTTTLGQPSVNVAAPPDVEPRLDGFEFTRVSYETPVMPAVELKQLHDIDGGGYAKQVLDIIRNEQAQRFTLAQDESRREDRRLEQKDEELRLQKLKEKGERDHARDQLAHEERMLDTRVSGNVSIAKINADDNRHARDSETAVIKKALNYSFVLGVALTGTGIAILALGLPAVAAGAAFTGVLGTAGIGGLAYRKLSAMWGRSKKALPPPEQPPRALPPPKQDDDR